MLFMTNLRLTWYFIPDPNSLTILTADNEAYSTSQGMSGEIPAAYTCHDSIFTETNAAYASVTENTYDECDVYIKAKENIDDGLNLPSEAADYYYT